MVEEDTLWKGVIEELVEEFIRFFFPEAVETNDFSKGFVFLDKELEKLSPDAESRRRHADKLIRAHLRDGREQWFLVHVEVQGYDDPDFGRRMFQYFYRIRDKYDRPLTALAIYTDRNRKFHFSEYREDYLGTGVRYYFKKFV